MPMLSSLEKAWAFLFFRPAGLPLPWSLALDPFPEDSGFLFEDALSDGFWFLTVGIMRFLDRIKKCLLNQLILSLKNVI